MTQNNAQGRLRFCSLSLLLILAGFAYGNNDYCTEADASSFDELYNVSVSPGGDVDWFRFTIPQNGTIRVTLEVQSGKDIDLSTYASCGSEWTCKPLLGPGKTEVCEKEVSAGSYYVKVEGINSVTIGGYTLYAQFSPKTCTECSSVCGDGLCDSDETASCPQDCPTVSCGSTSLQTAASVSVGQYIECRAPTNYYAYYVFQPTSEGAYKVESTSLDGSAPQNLEVRMRKNGYDVGTFCQGTGSGGSLSCSFYFDPVKDAGTDAVVHFTFQSVYPKYKGASRWHASVQAPYCGDGGCSLADCASGCTQDCQSWKCSNNGQCDPKMSENCWSSDCKCTGNSFCIPSRPGAAASGCYDVKVGDDYCDSSYGENQETACTDCGCPGNMVCDESSNKCVECVSDLNCKKVPMLHCHSERQICVQCQNDVQCGGKKCDPTTFTCVGCVADSDCLGTDEWSGQFRCSADHKSVEETGTKKVGRCQKDTCAYAAGSTVSRVVTDCGKTSTFCQDGKCGCSEGYDKCEKAGQCVKVGSLDVNSPCYCDFQCGSGYCKAGTCIQTASVELSATKSILDIGDKSVITLSVSNTLNEDTRYDLVLNIGSGAFMETIISGGQSCSGNQCKLTGNIPAKSKTDITIQVDPQQAGSVMFTADITLATTTGQTITLPKKELTLNVKRCGDGTCSKETGETVDTCCADCGCRTDTLLFKYDCRQTACTQEVQSFGVVLGALILVFIIIPAFLAVIFRRHVSDYLAERRRRAEEAEQKAKEEAEKASRGYLTFEKLAERVKDVIAAQDYGRGVSFRRIRNSIPGESDVRIWDVIADLIKDNEIEDLGDKQYRISHVKADAITALMEEKERGRGVSLRRLAKFSDFTEDELKGELNKLKKAKRIEERDGKYWLKERKEEKAEQEEEEGAGEDEEEEK